MTVPCLSLVSSSHPSLSLPPPEASSHSLDTGSHLLSEFGSLQTPTALSPSLQRLPRFPRRVTVVANSPGVWVHPERFPQETFLPAHLLSAYIAQKNIRGGKRSFPAVIRGQTGPGRPT